MSAQTSWASEALTMNGTASLEEEVRRLQESRSTTAKLVAKT